MKIISHTIETTVIMGSNKYLKKVQLVSYPMIRRAAIAHFQSGNKKLNHEAKLSVFFSFIARIE